MDGWIKQKVDMKKTYASYVATVDKELKAAENVYSMY